MDGLDGRGGRAMSASCVEAAGTDIVGCETVDKLLFIVSNDSIGDGRQEKSPLISSRLCLVLVGCTRL